MKRKKGKQTLDDLVEAGRHHVDRGELAEAEACFREALAKAPDELGLITLLGLLLVEREKFEPAIDLLERAREAAPDAAPIHLALGSAYEGAGHEDLAVTAMETAIKLDNTSTIPLERLAKHYIVARKPREAIGLLRRVLRRDPSHAHARFLLAGLTGESKTDEKAPAELIADLFDAYAAKFDQHLVGKLGYSAPAALAALIADTGATPDGSWRILDLGCGTGLSGVDFRPYAKTLIGSDLSPRMIARARERSIYDELHVEDLLATLARERDIDLIVAADVLIYVGALEATFAACAKALRPGGLLAFSVETSTGSDVNLESTLRYTHSDAYVQRQATAHGFTVARQQPTTIRAEQDRPVEGFLYVLEHTSG